METYGRTRLRHPEALDSLEKSNNVADSVNSIAVEVSDVNTGVLLEQIEKSHENWRSKLQDSSRSDGILWDTKTDRNPKEAEIVQAEAKSRRDDGLNLILIIDEDKTFEIKKCMKELGIKLDLNKITTQLGLKIGCLLLLFFCLQQIAYMSTTLIDEGAAIDRTVDINVPKVLEFIPAERTENPRDKFTELPTGKFGANPESSSSDAKSNADLLERTCSCPPMDSKVKPPNIQVFINFRGNELRRYFIGYLVDALRRSEINVFIDTQANIGDDLTNLFKRIEDSGIAIVVFSNSYTESKWCLDELVKIKELAHQGLLKVLPIFYKVTPTNVKRLKGDFGDNFREQEYRYESDEPKIKRWKEAITFVSHKFALIFYEKSCTLEIDFVETIVTEVLKMLQAVSTVENGQSSR